MDELEEHLKELALANKKLSEQIEKERKEREREKSRLIKNEEEMRKQINELKHKHQLDMKGKIK